METSLVYKMLQGPYEEYHVTLPLVNHVPLCWSGILLVRILLLIITKTYVYNILTRLLIMTTITFLALLHHLVVKPCKENRANMAGTISCAALLSVCIINLVRAAFEVAEFIPLTESHVIDVVNGLHLVEDSLLFWIPLVGACVMVLFLVGRFTSAMFQKCIQSKHK